MYSSTLCPKNDSVTKENNINYLPDFPEIPFTHNVGALYVYSGFRDWSEFWSPGAGNLYNHFTNWTRLVEWTQLNYPGLCGSAPVTHIHSHRQSHSVSPTDAWSAKIVGRSRVFVLFWLLCLVLSRCEEAFHVEIPSYDDRMSLAVTTKLLLLGWDQSYKQ